ncbi:MAG: sterol desaturase family protein [Candidatus Obscuribacterales bacterium]|nr:sterol desaturase family protein [Steroidobacteraceae bacterium]
MIVLRYGQQFVIRYLFLLTLIGAVSAALLIVEFKLSLVWITLGIPVAVLAMVAALERVKPYRAEWNHSHGDLRADLSSLLVVAGAVEPVIGVLGTVIAATVYAQFEHLGWLTSRFPSHWPLLLQAVLLVLLADLGKYWVHRFGHETELGWRLHSVHHAVKRVYWLNGFRIHPLYHLINFAVGVLPWVCLGASAQVVALYTVILAVSAAFQHANIDLCHGRLNEVFNTNEVHRWHHSRRLEESNANYGAVTLLWDWLFGSYRRQPSGCPDQLGMVIEAGYPMNSYFKQLAVPFLWNRHSQSDSK